MRRRLQLAGAVALIGLLGVVGAAVATSGKSSISERLSGYQEVPAVSTGASGKFEAKFARFGDTLRYRLSYRDLEGRVTQAHIHLGQRHVNGGITVWLCGNPSDTVTPPPNTPMCPASPATVTDEIGPEDVVGPAGQGIELGEYDEFVAAVEAGVTYANVHSARFPGGEIRAQLKSDRDH